MADYEKTDEGQDGHLNEIYKGSEQECQKRREWLRAGGVYDA